MQVQLPILIGKRVCKTTPIRRTRQTDIHVTQLPVTKYGFRQRTHDIRTTVFFHPSILSKTGLRVNSRNFHFLQLVNIIPFIEGFVTATSQFFLIQFSQLIIIITERQCRKPVKFFPFHRVRVQHQFHSPVLHLSHILVLSSHAICSRQSRTHNQIAIPPFIPIRRQ